MVLILLLLLLTPALASGQSAEVPDTLRVDSRPAARDTRVLGRGSVPLGRFFLARPGVEPLEVGSVDRVQPRRFVSPVDADHPEAPPVLLLESPVEVSCDVSLVVSANEFLCRDGLVVRVSGTLAPAPHTASGQRALDIAASVIQIGTRVGLVMQASPSGPMVSAHVHMGGGVWYAERVIALGGAVARPVPDFGALSDALRAAQDRAQSMAVGLWSTDEGRRVLQRLSRAKTP